MRVVEAYKKYIKLFTRRKRRVEIGLRKERRGWEREDEGRRRRRSKKRTWERRKRWRKVGRKKSKTNTRGNNHIPNLNLLQYFSHQ